MTDQAQGQRRRDLRGIVEMLVFTGAGLPYIGLLGGALGSFSFYAVEEFVSLRSLRSSFYLIWTSACAGIPPGFFVLLILWRPIERAPAYRRRARAAASVWLLLCAGVPQAILYIGVTFNNNPTSLWLVLSLVLMSFALGAGLAASLAIHINTRPTLVDRDTSIGALVGGGILAVVMPAPLFAIWDQGVIVFLLIPLIATPLSALWFGAVCYFGVRSNPNLSATTDSAASHAAQI